jgi:hypothetical protein
MFLVEVRQSIGHLSNVLGRLFFREIASLLELLVKLSLSSKFQNQVNSFGIVKVAIKTQDIGVSGLVWFVNIFAKGKRIRTSNETESQSLFAAASQPLPGPTLS